MKQRKIELGTKNLVGQKVTQLRKQRNMKQRELLAKMQTHGVEISSSGLSKLEGQTRPVTDKELVVIARIFDVSLDELLSVAKSI